MSWTTSIQRPGQAAEQSREQGVIAVSTAIVLVMVLSVAALGIDVAMFYTRSAQLQRTADAAALAGVAKMPDFAQAEAAAKMIATQNRIDASMVTAEKLPNSPQQMRVVVSDPKVRSLFGQMFRKGQSMTRSSVAEYVPRIEMGSKLNAIGTGSLLGYTPSGAAQNFWLAINGACTAREDGDRYASKWDGNNLPSGAKTCGPGMVNYSFRSEGSSAGLGKPSYSYLVTVPCPTPGQDPCTTPLASPVNIAVYNPIFDRSNDPTAIDANVIDPAVDINQFYRAGFDTAFQLRTADGASIPGKNTQTFGTCENCAASNRWFPLWDVTQAGRYRVDVSTLDHYSGAVSNDTFGSNAFGLAASTAPPGADPVLCATAGCPSVSGESDLSVYATVSGGVTDFYLARLSPARYYRGKKVQIQLFDPGEGAQSIQILQPTTGPTPFVQFPFSYRTWNPNLAGYSTDTGFPLTPVPGPGYALDVTGAGSTLAPAEKAPWWGAYPASFDSKFNGRVVSIELQIPTSYGCVGNTIPCVEGPLPEDGWWKIRYNTGAGDVSDRTTWTVQLVGDPVHLVH